MGNSLTDFVETSMFWSIVNRLHEIVSLYFFGLGLIFWISQSAITFLFFNVIIYKSDDLGNS